MPIGTKSLAFINHKPFHPGSMANMEKVWIAEQKNKEVKDRQKELLEKRQQEGKIEELRRALREGEGTSMGVTRKLTLAQERMEWMYENPATIAREKEQEEYRLGKKIEPHRNNEVETERQSVMEDGTTGTLFLPSLSKQTEDTLRKIREDPLYQFKQAEAAHRRERMARNPELMIKRPVPEEAPESEARPQRKRSLSRSLSPRRGHYRRPPPMLRVKPSMTGPSTSSSSSSSRRPRMSSEERRETVEQMMADGRRHEKEKDERLVRSAKREEVIDRVEQHFREKKGGKSYFAKLEQESFSRVRQD